MLLFLDQNVAIFRTKWGGFSPPGRGIDGSIPPSEDDRPGLPFVPNFGNPDGPSCGVGGGAGALSGVGEGDASLGEDDHVGVRVVLDLLPNGVRVS